MGKFCRNCGAQLEENQNVCLKCGTIVEEENNSQKPAETVNDTGSIGWGVLGFFVPIAGLILYLVWKNTQPKNAKAAGKGALACVIVSVIMYVIYFIVLAVLV